MQDGGADCSGSDASEAHNVEDLVDETAAAMGETIAGIDLELSSVNGTFSVDTCRPTVAGPCTIIILRMWIASFRLPLRLLWMFSLQLLLRFVFFLFFF